jgi:hypothetical protein
MPDEKASSRGSLFSFPVRRQEAILLRMLPFPVEQYIIHTRFMMRCMNECAVGFPVPENERQHEEHGPGEV